MNSELQIHYDVIIVGARIAGCTAAIRMARKGLKVLLLEMSPVLGNTLSTHLLQPYAVERLIDLGLGEKLTTQLKLPRAFINFSTGKLDIQVTAVNGVDYFLCPKRTWLDLELQRLAEAENNINFIKGFWVEALLRDQVGKVSGVSGRYQGKVVKFEGDLIVGGDGRNSTIAKLAASDYLEREKCKRYGYYGYYRNFQQLNGPAMEWHVGPKMYFAFPMAEGLTCLAYCCPPDEKIEGMPEVELAKIFHVGNFGERAQNIVLEGKVNELPPNRHELYYKEPAGAGWALIGDAAMHTDPMFAQGIGTALITAEALANFAVAGKSKYGKADALTHEFSNWHKQRYLDLYKVTTYISGSLNWGSSFLERRLQKLSLNNPRIGQFAYSIMNQLVQVREYYPRIILTQLFGIAFSPPRTKLPELPYTD